METVQVEVSEAGEPLVIQNGKRKWIVAAEPLRWYERVPWWNLTTTARRGELVRIDIEVWRVQARLGKNPKSALATFELVHDRDADTWDIRSFEVDK